MWNGKDAILKERLFGLTNAEGNHGEDVKEYYFYLDSTPTHSYMRYLYKYPQAAYPYDDLVRTNHMRGRNQPEYELIDTGVFDQDRYFDVFVEYAKASPEDILIRCTVHNRGPDSATLDLLPRLWFRNEWSWHADAKRPMLAQVADRPGEVVVRADHPRLGTRYLYCEGDVPLLFTENETNTQRIFGTPNQSAYVKDGINDTIVDGRDGAVNPDKTGTIVAAHYRLTIGPGESRVVRLRLSDVAPAALATAKGAQESVFGDAFDQQVDGRRREADEFYATIIPASLSADGANVMRQALAGMLWSKQYYRYDVHQWLKEHGSDPFNPTRKAAPRNDRWHHMYNADVISMPDKWEYPWYAAWDLGFHVLALTLVDPDFGKQQLKLLLQEHYMHPNGQLPAYEWNFGDVNPPVHAFATIFAYRLEKAQTGVGDTEWLESCFHKLLLNFGWWVNRVDRTGRNVFEGGFLGLDNISPFDRSAPLPNGGHLEQSDATAWMTLFSQNMLEIAAELAMSDPSYAEMSLKFIEHFMWIASAMGGLGDGTGMWDEEDGFFYDLLRLPDGSAQRLKVRSMVGLLPLCAGTTLEAEQCERFPEMQERFAWFLNARPELAVSMHDPRQVGVDGRRLMSILNEERLRRVLAKMLDENEFLSPYGLRSVSRYHAEHPYVISAGGQVNQVVLCARGVRQRTVRRQLELARPRLDADQRPHPPGPPAVPRVLRRRLHDRMPDGLGSADDSAPGRRGTRSPVDGHLPEGRGWPATRLRRNAQVPGRPALARLPVLPRIFPRRQRRGPGREPPDRLDGSHRKDHAPVCNAGGRTGARGETNEMTMRWSCPWQSNRARVSVCASGRCDCAWRQAGKAGRRLRVHRGADV